MNTSGLIDALAADVGVPPARPIRALGAALAVAGVGAAAVFALVLGPRPDIAAAVETVRFPMKFVFTLLLAATAFALLSRLGRPGADLRIVRVAIVAAPVLLLSAVAIELFVLPHELWEPRLVGRNGMLCLASIPMLSAIPLAATLLAARRGAPSSPTSAGAVAGLLAGAIGATFYAAHCPDDSPLFVATWYTLAIAAVAVAGAAMGSRALRW